MKVFKDMSTNYLFSCSSFWVAILLFNDTNNFVLVKRRREFVTDRISQLERKDFDPKLPELRKRILRITKSNQFHSQFTNNDALYSNDMNKRLFTDLEAGSLNVYTWTDLCSDDIDRMKGFISFPHNPLEKYLIHGLNSIESLDVSGKRIFGYISPPMSGSYSFQVIYYGSIEFWLSPDSLPVNAVLYQTSTPVVVSRLDKKILSEQVAKMSHFTVPLVAYKKQYIEIQHASRFGGLVEVKAKEKYSSRIYTHKTQLIQRSNPVGDQSRLRQHWSVTRTFGGPWEKTLCYQLGIDSRKNPDDIIFIH